MFFQLIFNMLSAFLAAMVAYVLIEAPLRNLLAGGSDAGEPTDGRSEAVDSKPESLIAISLQKQQNRDTFLKQHHLNVQALPTPDPSDYASSRGASSVGRLTLESIPERFSAEGVTDSRF